MKNLMTLTVAIPTCIISFIEFSVSKTQISVLSAELLFMVAGFTAFALMLQNKKTLQPVKVKAYKKY